MHEGQAAIYIPVCAQTAAHLSPQSLFLLLDCGQVGHQLAVVALLMLQLQTEARTCQATSVGVIGTVHGS